MVEKARTASQSVSRIVFLHFELIEQARGLRVGWKEIGESLEFGSEKISRLRKAYSLERRRRAKKKEKEVVPEKKKEQKTEKRIGEEKKPTPEPGIQPDPLPMGTSSPKLQNPGSRDSGERTSPITLLPRGHFRIEPDRPDDKL